VFKYGLGDEASVETIKDIFYNLLLVLDNPHIVIYQESIEITRAINVVTLIIYDRSNQTTCLCALILLLRKCCEQHHNLSEFYTELVIKCIWRLIRCLQPNPDLSSVTQQIACEIEEFAKQIDSRAVFSEIHAFLIAFPFSLWLGKPKDMPHRTVRKLIFYLAKAKRDQVQDDLRELGLPKDAEVWTTVNKFIHNDFQRRGKKKPAADENNNVQNQTGQDFHSRSPKPTADLEPMTSGSDGGLLQKSVTWWIDGV
jgi:hypothetical protein